MGKAAGHGQGKKDEDEYETFDPKHSKKAKKVVAKKPAQKITPKAKLRHNRKYKFLSQHD